MNKVSMIANKNIFQIISLFQSKVKVCMNYIEPAQSMVYGLLDGNSEIGAHVRNNLFYFKCLRHLIRSKGVTNRK